MIQAPRTPDEHRDFCAFASDAIGAPVNPEGVATIGIRRDKEIAAVAVYHHYDGHGVELALGSTTPRWATPHAISAVLTFPFIHLGVQLLSAQCRLSNKRSQRLMKGVGFMREGKLHCFYPDNGHAVIFGMTRPYFLRSKWHGYGGSGRRSSRR